MLAPSDSDSGDHELSGADVELLENFLDGALSKHQAQELEARLRMDQELRAALNELVLLRAAAQLLRRPSGSGSEQCLSTRKLFRSYRQGTSSASETAQLSRHLEECFECELDFEEVPVRSEPSRRSAGKGPVYRAVIIVALLVLAASAVRFAVVGL